MIGEKIAQLVIEPINDDGLLFYTHGEFRVMRRAYHRSLIEDAYVDIAAVIIDDIESDGYAVTDDQRGMISMAIAAWNATHQEPRG